MTSFKIIDFYNSGAQVVVPAVAVDMTHTFGASAGGAEDEQIGYEPRGNAKLAEGAAYDELEHAGARHLLLKGGHVYAVKVADDLHVISAEEGHLSLPLPKDAEVDVEEYDEEIHGKIEEPPVEYTDEQVLAAAEAAHEANRAYCASIGDDTQVEWSEAEEWQRESAVAGVRGVIEGNTPEQSHESWLAFKEADGWVHGEVKDAEAKTHPCMVPYAELPDEQKAKDDIFVATVREALDITVAEEDEAA